MAQTHCKIKGEANEGSWNLVAKTRRGKGGIQATTRAAEARRVAAHLVEANRWQALGGRQHGKDKTFSRQERQRLERTVRRSFTGSTLDYRLAVFLYEAYVAEVSLGLG